MMEQQIFAVIDTNVFVSALISRNMDSATVQIVDCILRKSLIKPVYNDEILAEYTEVLNRAKFKLSPDFVKDFLESIADVGIEMDRTAFTEALPDPKDRVFYEVSLTEDSYLVTGNLKHFPSTPKVVTPAEMMQIINNK